MLTVHHLNNSRSQRVLWLLEELGVPYEIVRYQRQPDESFRPANPHFYNLSAFQHGKNGSQSAVDEIPVLDPFSRRVQHCVQWQRHQFQLSPDDLNFFSRKSQKQFVRVNCLGGQNVP